MDIKPLMNYTIFSPADFKKHISTVETTTSFFHTPAGILRTESTSVGMYRATFIDEKIHETQLSQLDDLTALSFILVGTPFQIKVWQELTTMNVKTMHYQALAEKIGHSHSYRAVAQALARNKIAYFIPCHRIVQKNGALGGYRWGINRKKMLLESMI